MKVELRRRLHEDHITFHYDLVLIPNKKESRIIDGFVSPDGAKIPVYEKFAITGEIQTADDYSLYLLIKPKRKAVP